MSRVTSYVEGITVAFLNSDLPQLAQESCSLVVSAHVEVFCPSADTVASPGNVSALVAFVGCGVLPFFPTLAMASRGARQRLKGSGGSGGDTASAADKLRELLCSRETGSAEPRPE